MGKHKKVSCRICLHVMRSDYLKTHTKQHVKRNENEMKKVIKKEMNVDDDIFSDVRGNFIIHKKECM